MEASFLSGEASIFAGAVAFIPIATTFPSSAVRFFTGAAAFIPSASALPQNAVSFFPSASSDFPQMCLPARLCGLKPRQFFQFLHAPVNVGALGFGGTRQAETFAAE